MAKWCFSLGIVCPHRSPLGTFVRALTFGQNLKRIEVIEDDESEIMEAVRRMSGCYDLVVTRCHRPTDAETARY